MMTIIACELPVAILNTLYIIYIYPGKFYLFSVYTKKNTFMKDFLRQIFTDGWDEVQNNVSSISSSLM